jgi:predicted dehydrogenase
MSVKIGLIGCGYWGVNLLRNFHRLGALTAISDANPAHAAKLSAEFNVTAMSLDDLIADPALDGIAIATPAETHADIAVRALKAGKHVFVEKPIALTEADANAIIAAAEANSRKLMVGHLLQYHPAFVTLRTLVKDGAIGKIRYVYSHRLSLGKLRVEENALWSFAPHDLSMVLSLFDSEPVTVTGTGGDYITPGIDDWNRVDMTFDTGASAHVFVSWLHPFKEHRFTIVGETGMIVFEDSAPADQKLRLYRHSLDTAAASPVLVKAEPEAIPYPAHEPLLQECQHFIDCIAQDLQPRTDAREALGVLRTLVRAKKA